MKKELEGLLGELEDIYSTSDIYQACLDKGYNYGYGLISTCLKPGRPLFLGFNWGAGSGTDFSSQQTVEPEPFLEQELGSFSRIVPYCRQYFSETDIAEASQSNFCFFRSESEKDISQHDIQLCLPIFDKLINIIQPSIVLGFSGKLRNHLTSQNLVQDLSTKEITFKRGKSNITYLTQKGFLQGGTKICFLPHPNYPMQKQAREQAWEFCFHPG
ncbi:hypothetical protein [Marinospirillum insulare]|uniref:Uracil DNA glycosylase superfamily protein n=1 Tax=Marinospirillum insulare TaxID=217169 RepID=A0ABQ5ZRL0_9GAMM|nr:hypothetical protein [Marinospirillum insulare]GLR62785.1 hypothetical protein GCM10007878_02200 [Marinospirillum insulare]